MNIGLPASDYIIMIVNPFNLLIDKTITLGYQILQIKYDLRYVSDNLYCLGIESTIKASEKKPCVYFLFADQKGQDTEN